MATIRDAEITGDFVHEPLTHPQDEIRLLQLDLSTGTEDEITCTTLTCAIRRPEPYFAISYTWGDMRQKRVIQVNGKRVQVGYNSWLALWQARLYLVKNRQSANLLWIDILSIDQANAEEKSIQVGLMGMIYKSAIFVIASVGPHEDDSELLAEQIHAQAAYIDNQREIRGKLEDKPLASIKCVVCNEVPDDPIYRCKPDCESIWFCRNCADYAYEDEVNENGTSTRIVDHRHSFCVQCDRELTRRYYTFTDRRGDGRVSRICKSCAQPYMELAEAGKVEGVTTSDFVLTDEWGDVRQPANDPSHTAEKQWQTAVRVFELSQDLHQRAIDALRAFSLRPYFTRLWIIQEIQRAQVLVFACGDSSFRYEMFLSLGHDLIHQPENHQHEERFHAITISVTSWHMTMFASNHLDTEASIWDLVTTYASSHCSDPRDRVFGLLGLAEQTATESIRPDYSKSPTQVFLQLLEAQAQVGEEDAAWARKSDCYEVGDVFDNVGNYGASPDVPEIATMLQQRRMLHHTNKLSLEPVSEDLGAVIRGQRRVAINVHSYCKLRRDQAGVWTAPLVWKVPPKTELEQELFGQDFRVDRNANEHAIRIRDPSGSVIALADTKSLPGDVLLFFDDYRPKAPFSSPVAGLVVRPAKGTIHSIVGQFIFDYGVRPCPIIRERDRLGGNREIFQANYAQDPDEEVVCECEGDEDLHGSGAVMRWRVFMSPEDLMLFTAQDLKVVEREPERDVAPMIDFCMWPEETARRLVTSVTDEPFSSYALCEVLR